ncbi:MAG: hypothetical protein IPJ93_00080 [Bacteroidota bacterium]|nr:MAG: hypothetical protein IPJ93_00080 [Bacteroidota bacterium]
MSQRILQAHCQSHTSQPARQSFVKELAKPTLRKIELKKISSPSENKKYATAQPDTTMTLKLNNDNGLQGQTRRTTGYNKVLPKAGLNGFDWTFVQGSTFVLRLSFCAKNPRLRQYPNRWTNFAPQRQFARLQRSSNCLILSNGSALPHAFFKLCSVANFVQLRVCKMPLVCSHAFFKQV